MITIIIFILVLSLLVFAHELGHFWVARRFGLKPKEFGFGFPPRAIGIYKSTENKWKIAKGKNDPMDAADTIYSINWIPLGGFVNLQEDEDGKDDPNHFSNHPIWHRASILSAGVTMNVILAGVLLAVGLMFGMPQSLDGVGKNAQISNRKIQVNQILSNTPAANAGLKLGDTIASVNGIKFSTAQELQDFTDAHNNQELTYSIKRSSENEPINIKITPQTIAETGKGGIGIGIAETGIVKYSWYLAIYKGFEYAILLTWFILVAFFNLIKGIFMGHGVGADLSGPVGIAVLTGEMARMGMVYLVQFTATLSVNLAIINFLPIPALDGGRVLFLILEKIKGHAMKKELESKIHYAGFLLLMILVVFVTFRDVANYGGGFLRGVWEKIINLIS